MPPERDEPRKEHSMKKKRMANMELLRILAMVMVVMLHYLSKGGLLPNMTESLDTNGYLAWILETFSIVAVNVYMLISGFFLTESRFKSSRFVELICQILFYSLLIPPVLIAIGTISVSDLTVYKLLKYMLPVEMEHYWFATAYVLLYLMSPVFKTAVHHMKQSQLKATIVLLLCILSLNKSILPVRLEMDKLGYDAIWFFCVFLCAAYLRLYGFKKLTDSRKGIAGYLVCCAGILGITLAIRVVYLKTGSLEDFLTATYHYNHILNLLAAICLFAAFYYMKLPDGKAADVICKIAPYTFGVYLFHEQEELRYLWPAWFGASAQGNPAVFVLRCIGSVLLMFMIGICIDVVRAVIFKAAGKLLCRRWVSRCLTQIDTAINGDSRSQQAPAERM